LRISDNFFENELLYTSQLELAAAQRAWLTDERLVNACRLAWTILEPLRVACGNKTVKVNSWLRCAELNSKIGGSANTQHLDGLAADIVPPGDMWLAYDVLGRLPIGQRIIYLSNSNKPTRIHVSAPGIDWIWDKERRNWRVGRKRVERDMLCYPDKKPKEYLKYSERLA
jgi:hypothetical protein